MPDNTIILDLRKIETGEHFDKYCKDLFAPIQHKTPEENRVLEADLYRSKIIIDIDGQRKICSSFQEFLDNSTMLTDDQHTYITNIGHQGLFGGGSAVMPVSFVACMPQDIIMQDTRSIANTLTDDVALCVYVKDGKVTLANTIQYKLTNIDGVEPKGNVTLSMVADITNVKKGSERETPIHMVISQPNVGTNIIHAIREAEPDAVIVSHDQKDHHFINTVRQDKARDNEITLQPFIRDTSDIDKLAAQNLDDSKPLIFRQTALNQA